MFLIQRYNINWYTNCFENNDKFQNVKTLSITTISERLNDSSLICKIVLSDNLL